MAVKKKRKKDALRDMVREELRAAVAGFAVEVADMTEAARDLNAGLFEMSVHQANIRDALRQSQEAMKVSAELRAEWVEAKMLSKIFEQRQFLRSPEAMEAKRILAKVNDLQSIGGGRVPGPDLPGSAPDERAQALLKQMEPKTLVVPELSPGESAGTSENAA